MIGKKVQFGPPGKLWFAPTPAQPQNTQIAAARPGNMQTANVPTAAARQFPRLHKPQPVGGDEQTQAASQPTQPSQAQES